MAQLLQGGHRDGDAGGRHNRTNEQCAVKFRAAHCSKAIERAVQQRTAHQRHKDADTSNQGCNGARTHKLLQVGAKAGAEHKQHNADFRKDRDGVTGLYQIQKAGANQQASKNLADNLRCLALAGDQRKEFCAQNNNRQIAKNGIHEISSPLGQSFIFVYSFSTLCSSLQ